MPYRFNFDLTRVSNNFFTEIAKIVDKKRLHKRIGQSFRGLVKKFRLDEITGLNISDAVSLVEDFVDIQVKNMVNRECFLKAKKRALLLPHCSRKYMDNRCRAKFDPSIPSYFCQHCSEDCLIHQATLLGGEKGYDVYILPGGSCVPKILENGKYEAVVGVACGEEIKLADKILEKLKLPGQAVPLLKNGCAYTKFDISTLKNIL